MSDSKAAEEANKNKRNQLIRQVVKRTAPYKRLFNSVDGETVIKDLKAEFNKPSVVADSPHETVIRAAQYDVLDYIEKQINFKGEEE